MIVLKDGECQQQDQRKLYRWMIKLYRIKIEKIGKKHYRQSFSLEDDLKYK